MLLLSTSYSIAKMLDKLCQPTMHVQQEYGSSKKHQPQNLDHMTQIREPKASKMTEKWSSRLECTVFGTVSIHSTQQLKRELCTACDVTNRTFFGGIILTQHLLLYLISTKRNNECSRNTFLLFECDTNLAVSGAVA